MEIKDEALFNHYLEYAKWKRSRATCRVYSDLIAHLKNILPTIESPYWQKKVSDELKGALKNREAQAKISKRSNAKLKKLREGLKHPVVKKPFTPKTILKKSAHKGIPVEV